MKRTIWQWYLLGGAVVAAAYLLLNPTATTKLVLYNGIGLSAVVAVVVGTTRNRPSHRLPWMLIAAGQTVFLGGDIVYYVYEGILRIASPFPSLADAGYLTSYPFLIAGLFLLLRARSPGRDTASLVDAPIIATSLGLLSWLFLMQPYLDDPTLTWPERLVSLAYPLMDVLVLASAARLAVAGGSRSPAYYLASGSLVGLLAADTVYGAMTLTGGYTTGGPVDIGWMAFYLLMGAAALHPSMVALSQPTGTSEGRLTRARLAFLVVVAVAAPTVVVVETIRGLPINVPVIVGGTSALFLLAIVRMVGLVRILEGTLQRLRHAGARDRVLRETGTVLVAATEREEICDAAAEAVTTLVVDDLVGVRIAVGSEEQLAVLASRGEGASLAQQPLVLDHLPPRARDAVRSLQPIEVPLPLDGTFPSAASGSMFLAPLTVHERLGGLVIVTTAERLPTEDADNVVTLTSQVSLALESVALLEDLARRHGEQRFRSLVQSSSDVIMIVEPDATIRFDSPSIERVLGYASSELVGTQLLDLVHPDYVEHVRVYLGDVIRRGPGLAATIECRIRHRAGHWLDVETVASNLLDDPNVEGLVLTTRDVSERKALEEQLTRQAFHDSLTGLANRLLFADRVGHALARREKPDQSLAVLFIDLDDFKTINDSLGHTAGDDLLRVVADRLRGCLRSADTAARLGGDEFAVLLEQTEDSPGVDTVVARLLEALRAPLTLYGKEVSVTASIGAARAQHAEQPQADVLLRNADAAMYIAKSSGKNRCTTFEPSMHTRVVERLELKADLKRAVEHDELELHYQPILKLDTGRVVALEALLRWDHPRRGRVPPIDFIPLAEETGLIVEVGRWVLEQACRQARGWPPGESGRRPLVSVNLSARQLQDPGIVDEVAECLRTSGLPARDLVLEVTETSLMSDAEATMERLHRLKALGLSLAIDDFGTGYSSLSYLQRFPVDIIKIDKTFVGSLTTGAEDAKLAEGILTLAKTLGVKTVAEGIEQPGQLASLRSLGCAYGQGFLFSRPLPTEALGRLLEDPDRFAGIAAAQGDGRGPRAARAGAAGTGRSTP
ncbi:MAG: EAL domain-containing protein [Actinobacteria bacterium]|nr:EAL domain-containing protein [Actinomycetota bacterium]